MIEVNSIKNKEQIEKMKEILKTSSLRNYCLFVLGINTGLRISDLLGLKIKDIYQENKIKKELTIKETKTKKTKTFQINKNANTAIKELIDSFD